MDAGLFTGIWPTPPMRSMFCRMLPKNGFAAFCVAGIGQPPMTGATAGRPRSSLRELFDPATEDGLWECVCEIQLGNFCANSWNPPRIMKVPPVQPSLVNFFSVLIQVAASFSCDELESYTIMCLLFLHFSNICFCSSSLKVSASFCTLNDARLSRVVGMQRLNAPAMQDLAYCVDTRRSRSSTSSMADSRMLRMCWGVAIVGPSVLLPLCILAGSVSARIDAWCEVRAGGSEGRGGRISSNSAIASVRPKPSKEAGEFLRGRSGNIDDSVESMRLGERGLGDFGDESLLPSRFSTVGWGVSLCDRGDMGGL